MRGHRWSRSAERSGRSRGHRRTTRSSLLRSRGALLAVLVVAHAIVLAALAVLVGVPGLPRISAPAPESAPTPEAVATTPARVAPAPEVAGRADSRPDQWPPVATDGLPPVPERASGRFEAAPGGGWSGPRADVKRYRVEVERGLPYDAAGFAEAVEATLSDPRSWASAGHRLVRVADAADFRIVLAAPETVDRLCAPLDTGGRVSCRNGFDVVINAWRWQHGAATYGGDAAAIAAYRRYVVNHETGHALGYGHVGCPSPGRPAPVMLQQTIGLGGCVPNSWPALVDAR